MKKQILFLLWLTGMVLQAQTKVSGSVKDIDGFPIAFANVLFPGSTIGTITNDDGSFYLESEQTYTQISVSFIGFETLTLLLENQTNYDLQIVLEEAAEQLQSVTLVSGKQSKKNNPAIDILRKIWAKKRSNGLGKFNQYAYDKYEKIEFDLNTIDSALMNSKMFKGLEFVFKDLDTSGITGKTYLPIFLNETVSKVYGDNTINEEKEVVRGVKNSGFNGNQAIMAYLKDLYATYDIYDNYLNFFGKSFTSPLSKTGIDTYNYVLADSTFIGDKWCYNIIYYPRRKSELTFKGDFWVNDSTFAIAKINMAMTKSANLNWVKELYVEQDFEVLSDSVFLLKRESMLSDFSYSNKEKSKGVYGKRTTVYDGFEFDVPKSRRFYTEDYNALRPKLFERDSSFWATNRLETLNKDEAGIYKLIDTLKTVPKFKTYYNLVSILESGYIELDRQNIDIGDVYSIFGYNQAEGNRLRAGARTFRGQNDLWRLEGYVAYGFSDKKFKHGFFAQAILDPKIRLLISGGHRRDIEQLGLSLTATNDLMGRSIASSSVFTVGNNDKLSQINLTAFTLSAEPVKNLTMSLGASYRRVQAALPELFPLDFVYEPTMLGSKNSLNQLDFTARMLYTPGRKVIGYGVDPKPVNEDYPSLMVQYVHGQKNLLDSDFNFNRVQLSYIRPWQIGGIGTLRTSIEAGRTFDPLPLALLHVVPGNQTLFTIYNTFPNLDFYEFVTDTYVSGHLEHNFNGRLFSRIPFLRALNLREIIGVRGVWGTLSEENIALNAPSRLTLNAPNKNAYWEYSVGIGNIFKVFRIDANFRGNYLDVPGARPFSITGSFGFGF